jgi:hypothetical protein
VRRGGGASKRSANRRVLIVAEMRTPRGSALRSEPRTPRRRADDDRPHLDTATGSRRRHRDPRAVRELRNALLVELEEYVARASRLASSLPRLITPLSLSYRCRATLSDPNTVDGAPIRARMAAVEAELREVNKVVVCAPLRPASC